MNDYNLIAERYDTLFTDVISKQEDLVTSRLLGNVNGSVLDIGCGTGLLIEISNIREQDYLGIDPSVKMLEIFRKKHEKYKTIAQGLEDFLAQNDTDFDNIVCLYGGIAYAPKDAVQKLAMKKGKKFLMFFAEDYYPCTHKKTGIHPNYNIYTIDELRSIFGSTCMVYRYNNSYIVQTL